METRRLKVVLVSIQHTAVGGHMWWLFVARP